MVLNDENPWDHILAYTMFALYTMTHSTTQHTLAKLELEQDTIFNTRHIGNRHLIELRKQDLIPRKPIILTELVFIHHLLNFI